MPQTLSPPRTPFEPAPNRKRWTRHECEFLVQNELLVGRYELIDGEIISKMGQNQPHLLTVMRVVRWLMDMFGSDHVQCQGPIEVSEADDEINEPEPDVAVLINSLNVFINRRARPDDIHLVVEVSDTTLRFDLRNKAALYARAGIEEYWVVDVVGRRIIVHRQPDSESYGQILEYREDELVASQAYPAASIRVAELLAPLQASEGNSNV
jgi:Uma2 family endonuclease